jgi:hypothetical protein
MVVTVMLPHSQGKILGTGLGKEQLSYHSNRKFFQTRVWVYQNTKLVFIVLI